MKFKTLYWIIFGAAAACYGLLVLLVGPVLGDLTDGQTPFDLRVTGYSFEDAQRYFAGAQPMALTFYHDVLRPLDTVFPILFGLCLIWPVLFRHNGWWRLLGAFGLAYVVFDLAENAAIATMFRAGSSLDAAMVGYASGLTIVKFLMVPPALVIGFHALFSKDTVL